MVFIYILRCTEGKWYVGKTAHLQDRILAHFACNGAEWTKKYKPIEVEQIIPDCDDFDEDKYTVQTMSKHGIDNVRGGSFVRITLDKPVQDVLTNMLNSAGD